MIFELSGYTLDVDVERTKDYYKTARLVINSCSCLTCRNFDKAADSFPQEITDFFVNLGADIKKAREIYAIDIRTDNAMHYGGWLHLCGKIIAGEVAPVKVVDPEEFFVLNANIHKITDGFSVSFKKECNLPDESFPRPAFQLEIYADVPWVLEEQMKL